MAVASTTRRKGDGRGREGGRKKGTPNKVNKETRALLANFVEENWETFKTDYKNITDPEKKCSIFLQIMSYVTPKLQAVEYQDKTPPKTFKDELDEISGEPTRQ